ncbi:phage protease [Nitratidesulfovibrio liaohensis]|uniref:phage protease n=1 Tax=Nitratidesulfovibrio liaohensis TaxID=2604158 RepID=UPI00142378DC|nr:phage protease [Nitratidesulfovibrio liaohensis]NHZ48596.1 hypothetical protein [Nitratidesulfovibrio liaohensis]
MDTTHDTPQMLACHAVAMSQPSDGGTATPPEWVQLLPAGVFRGRDGRGPYRNDDPEGIVRATMAYQAGADIPIDYDHQSVFSEVNGQPAIAAAWISQLEVRNGEVWGRVTWTDKGAAHVASREYRYLSPVFEHGRKDGRISRIESVALTNQPNLQITAIASRRALRSPSAGLADSPDGCRIGEEAQPPTRGEDMDLKKTLSGILGLSPDSADDVVAAKVQGLVTAAHSANAGLVAIAKAVEAPDDAAPGVIADQVRAVASRAATPDPAKFVPIAMYQETASNLSALRNEVAATKAKDLVDQAKAAHKVTPAMEGWASDYATKDPEGFKAWMSASVAVVTPGPDATAGGPPQGGGKLTDTDRAICSQLGLSEEEYAKNIGKEGA